MSAEEDEITEVAAATPYGTARVADSYGPDPHEHKPSQDAWVAEEADEKQAETGGAQLDPGEALANREEEPSPGSSSEASLSSSESTGERTQSSGPKPARTTGNRTPKAQAGSSGAGTAASAPKER
jgi:hypothetical protein